MTYRLLIDGALVDGAFQLDVVDPARGEVFAQCARADAAQLDAAVAAAARAFPAWAARSWSDRAAMLGRLADAMEARAEDLAALLTSEQGKPLAQARFEVGGAIAAFRVLPTMEVKSFTLVDDEHDLIVEHRLPLGVVAAITPWNFPLILVAIKTACALAAGNTVVAKPAPTTPLTTMLLGELAAPILPPGVLNVIVDANDLGARLSDHPDVAKVSFTGSTGTGRKVMQAAAGTLKRLTLELGGNDAAILLDDVSVRDVAPLIFQAAMINAGQVCMAAKRIYAPRTLYDELCTALAEHARAAIVDDGRNQGAEVGPLQNKLQYDKVLEIIADARRRGRVIAGGRALDRPGYFIAPTVVVDLPDDARLVREEQFGPVIPVLAYDDEDDLVARVNDSEFGLAGSIWSGDIDRATALALRLQTGTIWINKHLDLRFDVPFGGAKQSGLGQEQGLAGIREFTQARVVSVSRRPLVAA